MALDLSRQVGVAYGPLSEERPSFATWRLFTDEEEDTPFAPKKAPEPDFEGLRFLRFEDRLIDALDYYQPTDVIIEATLTLQALARYSSEEIADQQKGLRALAVTCATRFSCAKTEVDARNVRKEVLALPWNTTRDVAKRAAMNWCRLHGMKVIDDNQADACALWFWHKQRTTPGALWRSSR